ncbi:MAG: DUF3185 family protein [Marinospirillum sp.]|uniref:DUF3185 family protein n=1 Tax=Marinospirillum sp. TaxID=2183934 RepID=UPI0019E21A7C|nr:DUF3185 family protein [Marinospirillum sp.]MBE0507701.1 DUF3185 family protein [Marinospirillum sp.]
MYIQNFLGVLLLLGGAALLYFGFKASQSTGEQIFESVAGRYTNSTVWYLVGGFLAAVGGLLLLVIR